MHRTFVRALLASALCTIATTAFADHVSWSPGIDPVRAVALQARLSGVGSEVSPSASMQVPGSGLEAGGNSFWETVPPPARWVHSTIYDAPRDRLVVFGGQSFTGSSNEVWTFSLSGIPRWQLMTPSGTWMSPRAFHTATFDSLRDRMIVFGGTESGAQRNDVWSLSFGGIPTWTKLAPTGSPPPPRSWHAASYDRLRDRILVSGGQLSSGLSSEVWALSLSGTPAWTKISPAAGGPGGRYAHTSVYDAGSDRLVLFGGLDAAGNPKNDVWALSLSGTPAWTQLTPAGTPPSARYGAGALFDRVRQRMVVFAGGTGTPNENDAWALSLGATPTWTKLAPSGPPQGRQFHSVSYDPIGDRLLAYGGSSGSILSDIWALPLGASTAWVPLSGTRRKGHSGLYDPARGRMIVFGGDNGTPLNDTWSLSLGNLPTWERLAPNDPLPAGRALHGAVYEPQRDRMVIFGGRSTVPLNDTWELTFSGELAWRQLTPTGTPPSPREDVACVLDASRGRMIVFGGADLGGVYNDVWALSLLGTPAWTHLTPTGTAPEARGAAQIAYDSVRDRVIVYGGFDRQFLPLGDAWVLTFTPTPAWTKLTPTGTPPAPRFAAAVVHDPLRSRLLVSGGTDFDQYFADTHALTFYAGTISAWSPVTAPGGAPTARSDHKAVYDPVSDRMLFFGGQNLAGVLHETWALEFASPVGVPSLPSAGVVELGAARPNPARAGSGTSLAFSLPRAMSRVELSVFDLAGRRIATLAHGPLPAGPQSAHWDGSDAQGVRAPSGVYFARLITEDGVATGKFVIAR
jgi:hypothetical protein